MLEFMRRPYLLPFGDDRRVSCCRSAFFYHFSGKKADATEDKRRPQALTDDALTGCLNCIQSVFEKSIVHVVHVRGHGLEWGGMGGAGAVVFFGASERGGGRRERALLLGAAFHR
ncbi:unnamed protein product [Ectocarpus fasciculatus]